MTTIIKMETEQTNHTANIMKELSDIKASLAVNTNETANIKSNISDIKGDIREIKNDSVNRREFTEALGTMTNMQKDVQFLQKIAYGGLAIVGALQVYLNFVR